MRFVYGREHIHGVKSNPCQGVKVTVPKVKRDRWLTDSEIETVLQALPRMKNQKAADIYLLILASLCRPGEAPGIKAEDVITLNGERVWTVAEPKNGKDFLIPWRVRSRSGELAQRERPTACPSFLPGQQFQRVDSRSGLASAPAGRAQAGELNRFRRLKIQYAAQTSTKLFSRSAAH